MELPVTLGFFFAIDVFSAKIKNWCWLPISSPEVGCDSYRECGQGFPLIVSNSTHNAVEWGVKTPDMLDPCPFPRIFRYSQLAKPAGQGRCP